MKANDLNFGYQNGFSFSLEFLRYFPTSETYFLLMGSTAAIVSGKVVVCFHIT